MFGFRPLGTAPTGTLTSAAPVVVAPPAPTVTGVLVSPATATITNEGLLHFSATVLGLNSPSQAVAWTKDGGGLLDAAGNFVPPPQTSTTQVITLTATSVQDGVTKGFATITILALSVTPPAPIALTAGSPTTLQAVSTSGAITPILVLANKPAPRTRTIVMGSESRSMGV